MFVAESARKHGIEDSAMLHALEHPFRIFDLEEEFTMVIGADHAGNLLEIGVVESDNAEQVIVHAMLARRKFMR